MKKLLLCLLGILMITSGCKNTIENGSSGRVFDPHTINVGDDLDGFTVTEVFFNEYGMEKVVFDGNFNMTGTLIVNSVGDSRYKLICTKDDIVKTLPVATTWELDKYDSNYRKLFNLLSDKTVSEAIGKERVEAMMTSIEDGIELKYKISASFSGFTYWYQPNTDVSSNLELIEMLSIEEINR